MTELDPSITIEDLEPEPGSIIRINPPAGDRRVRAFARLAVAVDRAPSTEIPLREASATGIHVHARPPEPSGAATRLRHEAVAALTEAQTEHATALGALV